MNRKISNLKSQVPNRIRLVLGVCNLVLPAKRGFTLIETLIAVTILALAVAGPLYSANRAIVAAQNSRDQLVASYLAQEGIEYIRKVRDNGYLSAYQANPATASSVGWNNFSSSINGCREPSTCLFDPVGSGTLTQCFGSSCTPLWLSNANVYSQTQSGKVTLFTRIIQTKSVTLNDEQIISKVSWNFHGVPYEVKIVEHLTPWQ